MINNKKVSGIRALTLWVVSLCISAGMLYGTGPNLQGPASSLVLKSQATVSDSIVKVKDVLQMDASTRNQIGNLIIAPAPELGSASTISKREVYEKLIGNGFTLTPTQLKGANTVKVFRKGLVVKPTFFKTHILNYITTHSRWKDGVSVSIVTAKDIVIPEDGVRWQLMPANGQDFFGNILFKINAYSPKTNEMIYSNWIVAKLKIVKRVAISNRSLQSREPIRSEDIRWEDREITVFTKNAILNEAEIVGHRTGRIIRPNTVITENLMAKQFLVQRGGVATLVAKINNVKATSTVKVLSNGALGENVRVMNTVSKKILSAIVTGKNRLEVTVE